MAMNMDDITGIVGGFRSYNSGTGTGTGTKDTIKPTNTYAASSSKGVKEPFHSSVSAEDLEKSKAKVRAVVEALKKSKTDALKSKETYKEATLGRKGEYDSVDNAIEEYNKADDLGEVAVHETPEERYFSTFVNNPPCALAKASIIFSFISPPYRFIGSISTPNINKYT